MNAHSKHIFDAGETIVARARSLATLVNDQSAAGEQGATMTDPVVDALKETELFWLLVPKSLGGLQADLLTSIAVWEEVSRADASAGWALMTNSTGTAVAAGFCSDDAVAQMFTGRRRAIMAGMLGPGGTCEAVPGGYRGSGKYQFGSGFNNADWIGAGMHIREGDGIRRLPNGTPQVQVCYVPRDKVNCTGNWDVFGLTGTGSFDYALPELFVAEGFTLERSQTAGKRDWNLYQVGIAGLACAGHTGVALGIMKRALEEIAHIAFGRRRPAYQTVLGEHPVFRRDFAYHEASYQAARAFTWEVYRDAQDTLAAGGTLSDVQRQRFRQNVIHVHRVAADVVRFAYESSGSEGLRNPSAIGRCMRDMYAATQHIFVDTNAMVDVAVPILDRWQTAGAALATTR